MKTFTQSLKTIALALILALGVSYGSAWTVPTAAPTGGNVASPLNTSANLQYKNGTLGVDLFRSYGNLIVDGRGSFGGDVVVASGMGITLGGVRNTTWPSGGVPSGAVMFFNLSSCPSGWSEVVSARGRYIVGLPSGGTLGGTAGTSLSDLENRAVGLHTHGVSDPGHSHRFNGGGTVSFGSGVYRLTVQSNYGTHLIGSSATGISIQNAGTVEGTNAPYIQLLTCQKN